MWVILVYQKFETRTAVLYLILDTDIFVVYLNLNTVGCNMYLNSNTDTLFCLSTQRRNKAWYIDY